MDTEIFSQYRKVNLWLNSNITLCFMISYNEIIKMMKILSHIKFCLTDFYQDNVNDVKNNRQWIKGYQIYLVVKSFINLC